jgi:DNA helicase-2/ATP-dependent DNA helicase PcrA
VPSMDDLSPQKQELLGADGNLLVLGGPGSGKTTIALLKASREIRPGRLAVGQRIIFLSFARATIARVIQRAGKLLEEETSRVLEINTYHGFIWRLIRSHGYLLRSGRIALLPPPQAAARLARIKSEAARDAEKRRLFDEEGLLHFDLFASVAANLLWKSQALRRIICDAYPIIVLDEFQDTNADEWAFIKTLGTASTLIALADAEQRIYEFRGADPRRIGEFTEQFQPSIFDFGAENHRSDGRDITAFGNDLLRGTNRERAYNDVTVERYGFYRGLNALFPLKCTVLKRARAMEIANPGDWSLAVLVPTKRLMLQVSDYLGASSDGLPSLSHDVLLDSEGPALAAVLISGLLEGGEPADLAPRLIRDLCEHISGRRGGSEVPPQGDLDLVGALANFLRTGQVRGRKRQRIVEGAKSIGDARRALNLTGNPEQDWLAVRRLLAESGLEEYVQVAEDARYLRLLHKGAALRSRLSELWRAYGDYRGAPGAVEDALLQEHFVASVRDWRWIHVMTLHKSKGKEFTEVVILDGAYHRLLWPNASDNEKAQALLALRVAVTRAMQNATIMTPKRDACEFL